MWPQRDDCDGTGGCGQGDDGGERDVLPGDAPQRESCALYEHDPGPAQRKGAVAQARWDRVDEQAVDPGGPGVAKPGEDEEPHSQGEARTGGEGGQRDTGKQGGRDDDAPLQPGREQPGGDDIGGHCPDRDSHQQETRGPSGLSDVGGVGGG
jgi:hypothetical protein